MTKIRITKAPASKQNTSILGSPALQNFFPMQNTSLFGQQSQNFKSFAPTEQTPNILGATNFNLSTPKFAMPEDYKGNDQLPADVNTTYNTTSGKPQQSKLSKFGDKLDNLFALGNTIGALVTNEQKTKESQRKFREGNLPDNLYTPQTSEDRGDWSINTGQFRPTGTNYYNPGQFGNAFYPSINYTEFGGVIPKMEYGGQRNYALDVFRDRGDYNMGDETAESISSTMEEKDELGDDENYVVMAENNETVVGDFDNDGELEFQKISGDFHSAPSGGTALTNKQLPGKSFIFPQTKKMYIKDPEFLKSMGVSNPPKGGISPAELSKKFDIMKEKAILDNKDEDQYNKRTAEMVKKNKEAKLQKLAEFVEKMKGNPQGRPDIYGSINEESDVDNPSMQKGGMFIPRAQVGLQYDPYRLNYDVSGVQSFYPMQAPTLYNQPFASYRPSSQQQMQPVLNNINDIVPWEGDRFQNTQNASVYGKELWARKLRNAGYTGPLNNMSAEQWMYSTPEGQQAIDLAHTQYPGTIVGNPPSAYDPAHLGYRWDVGINAIEEANRRKKYGIGVEQTIPYEGQTRSDFVPQFNIPAPETLKMSSSFSGKELTKAEKQREKEQLQNDKKSGKVSQDDFDFMTPDKLNMLATMLNPPKKYMPMRRSTNFEPGRVAFQDWTGRAAQRFATQFAAPANVISTYGDPQSLGANLSYLSGQTADAINQDIMQTEANNIQLGNQFAQTEQTRKDAYNEVNRMANQNYWNELATVNQQYDNSLRDYMSKNASAYGKAWNNRMNLGYLNATDPSFKVDPRTGRNYFAGPSGSFMRNTSQPLDFKKLQQQWMTETGGGQYITFKDWMNLKGLGSERDVNKNGVSDRVEAQRRFQQENE
jgi:hypothetical protein